MFHDLSSKLEKLKEISGFTIKNRRSSTSNALFINFHIVIESPLHLHFRFHMSKKSEYQVIVNLKILLVLILKEVLVPEFLHDPSRSKQCCRQVYLSYHFKGLQAINSNLEKFWAKKWFTWMNLPPFRSNWVGALN